MSERGGRGVGYLQHDANSQIDTWLKWALFVIGQWQTYFSMFCSHMYFNYLRLATSHVAVVVVAVAVLSLLLLLMSRCCCCFCLFSRSHSIQNGDFISIYVDCSWTNSFVVSKRLFTLPMDADVEIGRGFNVSIGRNFKIIDRQGKQTEKWVQLCLPFASIIVFNMAAITLLLLVMAMHYR